MRRLPSASTLPFILIGIARMRLIGIGVLKNKPTHNKSLDASRTSGFLIDNLRVAQLHAAASTQTLAGSHEI